jgi:hypothetical protein
MYSTGVAVVKPDGVIVSVRGDPYYPVSCGKRRGSARNITLDKEELKGIGRGHLTL